MSAGTPSLSQIPLDLAPETEFTLETFHAAPSNQGALRLIRAWPDWPAPAILLLGPDGSGKTHLGRGWARQSRGEFLDDAQSLDEDHLFARINAALRGEGAGLVLASRTAPHDWGIRVPDLRSRLLSLPVVHLEDPDDESLVPILRALFEQQGRIVPPEVINYLLK